MHLKTFPCNVFLQVALQKTDVSLSGPLYGNIFGCSCKIIPKNGAKITIFHQKWCPKQVKWKKFAQIHSETVLTDMFVHSHIKIIPFVNILRAVVHPNRFFCSEIVVIFSIFMLNPLFLMTSRDDVIVWKFPCMRDEVQLTSVTLLPIRSFRNG